MSDYLSTVRVPGVGPVPCDVMFVGEFPGKDEVRRGEPLVGRSGQEFSRYLNGYTIPRQRRDVYLTNLSKQFAPDTKHFRFDDEDERTIWDEIQRVQPRWIVTMGMHATQYFLGDALTLEMCHGIPHASSPNARGYLDGIGPQDVQIIPTYNPAAALHNPKLQAQFAFDMRQVGLALRGRLPDPPVDRRGEEVYVYLTGEEVQCDIDRWLNG